MHRRSAFVLGAAALTVLLPAFVSPARAQIAVSATLESDYRFRGPSLTDRRPALSLNLSYDHASGAYFGGSVIATDTHYDGLKVLGVMEYAGFVKRVNPELALDVGVSNANLNRYNGYQSNALKYTEVYAGAIGKNLNFRAYFSPNYLRSGVHTAYLDLGGVVHPRDKWRLFGHVGVLTPINDEARAIGLRRRYDIRAGVAREFKNSQLHLVWTTYGPQRLRPGAPPPKRSAIVLGATYFF